VGRGIENAQRRKIFVFLNLVFSLVVGALAVFNYAARTQWAKGVADRDQVIQVPQASVQARQVEQDRIIQENGKQVRELNTQMDRVKDELARTQEKNKSLSDDLVAAQKKLNQQESLVLQVTGSADAGPG